MSYLLEVLSLVYISLCGALYALSKSGALVLFQIGFNIVFLGVMARTYLPHLTKIFALYKANPPRDGSQGLDPKQFMSFFGIYKNRCHMNMMASLALILSLTVYLNIDAVKAQAPQHLVLQTLMVTTMANALSGLYLSVLFADKIEEISASYGLTISWVQRAVALSAPGAAIVLSTPFGMTGSAIITSVIYRVTAGALSLIELDGAARGTKSDYDQYIALAAVMYIVFVIIHTVVTAKMFMKLKAPASLVTPSLADAR
ncbi:uncharacterized protein PHACADRAFT_252619 [Phanerochaete carnosa HHB-10118-sp]|uniref:Uncharacterized protein n=1 Tax=Phanerochaete carnosa (strain HHB-10118-sp) TaxID=650164 RepID=K5WGE0_PHACS|nr:uncharacterized protein PHACADRAFT_252619 [Phanerochaete carnosa HHB-10118-sp]EKM58360.1 hypothetical protein PHACADRAFT_252619 [Phanerochaete carnosa HHB-10118-sp]